MRGRDLPRVREGGRRLELDVERHQRRPCRHQDRAGGRVKPRRAEVRHELPTLDPLRQRRGAASPQLRPGSASGQDAVQEHRQPEPLAEQVGQHQRLGAGGAAVLFAAVHDRRHVDGAHARVDPVVPVDRHQLDGLGRPARDRVRQLAGLAGEREHAAVVVRIGVHVEQPPVERAGRSARSSAASRPSETFGHGEQHGHVRGALDTARS